MRTGTLLILLALTVAACSIPGLERRSEYSGRRVLERDVVVEPVRHDQYGNPILSGDAP